MNSSQSPDDDTYNKESTDILEENCIQDLLAKESEYTKLILDTNNLIINHDYDNAMKNNQQALYIAKILRDNFKILESMCNFSIIKYFSGDFENSYKTLKNAYDQYNTTIKLDIQNLENAYLILKILSNLLMCALTLNKHQESIEYSEEITKVIESQVNNKKKLKLLYFVNYTLFRSESIVDSNSNVSSSNYSTPEDNISDFKHCGNNEGIEKHKQILNSLLNGFNKYLNDGNINIWINCLKENGNKMEKILDYSGLIFAIYNHEASIYTRESCLESKLNSGNTIKKEKNKQYLSASAMESKIKFSALLQSLKKNNENQNKMITYNIDLINEQGINKILNDYKNKMQTISTIYQKLKQYESLIKNRINSNVENIRSNNNVEDISILSHKFKENTNYFVKLIFNYTKSYILDNITDANLKSEIVYQLEQTICLIETGQINIDEIDLSSISPEIANSICCIFENLLYIYNFYAKKRLFVKYRKKVRNLISSISKKKLNKFLEENYNSIFEGEEILKINMDNTGTKKHFYKFDYDKESLIVFNSFNVVDREISTWNILKFMPGFRSNNLFRKRQFLDDNKRLWLYMSLIFNNRSVDFKFDNQEIAQTWFYGIYKYVKDKEKNYKVCSATNYVLRRIKMKILYKYGIDTLQYLKLNFSLCFLNYYIKIKSD